MTSRKFRWLTVAVAIVGMGGASLALGAQFSPSVADIHALSNNTSGFSGGNQLSTIDAIHIAPDGIHLDVTWRVGEGTADPFVTYPGETFSRVVLSGYQNNENSGAGRLLNPPYDGIKWCVMSDVPLSAQPYVQTAPSWQYFQPTVDTSVPGDMSMVMPTILFSSTLQGGGSIAPDVNGEIRSNAFGLQFFGPSDVPLGQGRPGHIWISRWVPEPGSASLLLMGLGGLFTQVRRKRG